MSQDNRTTVGVFVSFTNNATVPKNAGGTYQAFILTATVNGEVKNWTKPASALKFNKNLERQLNALKQGQTIKILETKNDKGFVEITGVHPVEDGAEGDMGLSTVSQSTSQTSKASSNSTSGKSFETAEERKAKQEFIIRQSSLSNAIALATAKGDKKVEASDIIATAETFVQYVLEGVVEEKQLAPDYKSTDSLEDDLPY